MNQQLLERYGRLARQTAAQGAVLLRNESNALPILKGEKVAIFGRIQSHYYKSGTGSGGMVNTAYVTDIVSSLQQDGSVKLDEALLETYRQWEVENPFDNGVGWAQEPWSQAEMPLTDELVQKSAARADIALVVIGRSAGEDKDSTAEKGSYFLSDLEEDMLKKVCGAFKRVAVILNVGSVMDMQFVEACSPQAVLYVWQGGQEGGNAIKELLLGYESPCGCLPDTIAKTISDYPSDQNFGDGVTNIYQEDIYVGYRYFETVAQSKVLYPFGFGLSYTTFETIPSTFEHSDSQVTFNVTVKNTGKLASRHVVQAYAQMPQGLLGKPARTLVCYGKTKELVPQESETLAFAIPLSRLASFDDSGITGHSNAYVLEKGVYTLFAGDNVRDALEAGSFSLSSDLVIQQLTEALAPVQPFERLKMTQNGMVKEPVPTRTLNIQSRIEEQRPENRPCTGDKGIQLQDVADAKASLDAFMDQLSDEALCCLMRGEGMSSLKVTPGTGAAFGGLTDELASFGIPIGCCTDGPSGIRMDSGALAFSMPNGTCMASTFDQDLIQSLFDLTGEELVSNNVELLLGPGMNIHRHPLNGRNFEYFSEDPYLTGTMAAAQLRGMGGHKVSGVIKHFACNNQEFKRHESNSVVSQRALREIYLKGYETAVKEGGAFAVMTTYGALNGQWTAGQFDLNTTILRNEWGFDGIVMTDWWAQINSENTKPDRLQLAAMVRAQNDIYMVVQDTLLQNNQDDLLPSLQNGSLTRGELLRCAKNILKVLMRTPVMGRKSSQVIFEDSESDSAPLAAVVLGKSQPEAVLPTAGLSFGKGESALYQVEFQSEGHYTLAISYSGAGDERAQMNVMLYMNRRLSSSFSLTGTSGQPAKLNENLGFQQPATKTLKLYVGQDGLTLHELRLIWNG